MARVMPDFRNRLALLFSVVVILLWGIPLLQLLREGLMAAKDWSWRDIDSSVWNSLGIAGGAASLACFGGGFTGAFLYKLPPRVRVVFGVLCLLPLFLPSYLHALAWSHFMGQIDWLKRSSVTQNRSGMLASIWVLSVSFYPIATAIFCAALSRWDRRLVWAAWANGLAPHRVAMMLGQYFSPWALLAWLILFLLMLGDFAVTDFYGIHTFSSEIFILISSYLDSATAIKKYFSFLTLILLGVAWLIRLEKRIAVMAPYASVWDEQKRAKINSIHLFLLTLFVMLVVALPVGNLVMDVGHLSVMRLALKMIAPDIAYGLAMAATIAAMCTIFALPAAYFVEKRIAPAGVWISYLSLLVFALPPSLLGLAMISLWNQQTVMGWAYDAGVVLWLAIGLRWCPLSLMILQHGWRKAGVEGEDGALANGIPWARFFLRVGLPRLYPHVATAFLLTLVFCFNELTLVTLLAPPGVSTLPLRVFQTVHYGPRSLLAAICVWQVLFLLLPMLCAGVFLQRRSSAGQGGSSPCYA